MARQEETTWYVVTCTDEPGSPVDILVYASTDNPCDQEGRGCTPGQVRWVASDGTTVLCHAHNALVGCSAPVLATDEQIARLV